MLKLTQIRDRVLRAYFFEEDETFLLLGEKPDDVSEPESKRPKRDGTKKPWGWTRFGPGIETSFIEISNTRSEFLYRDKDFYYYYVNGIIRQLDFKKGTALSWKTLKNDVAEYNFFRKRDNSLILVAPQRIRIIDIKTEEESTIPIAYTLGDYISAYLVEYLDHGELWIKGSSKPVKNTIECGDLKIRFATKQKDLLVDLRELEGRRTIELFNDQFVVSSGKERGRNGRTGRPMMYRLGKGVFANRLVHVDDSRLFFTGTFNGDSSLMMVTFEPISPNMPITEKHGWELQRAIWKARIVWLCLYKKIMSKDVLIYILKMVTSSLFF